MIPCRHQIDPVLCRACVIEARRDARLTDPLTAPIPRIPREPKTTPCVYRGDVLREPDGRAVTRDCGLG